MRGDASWSVDEVRKYVRGVFPEAAVALSDDRRWRYSDIESLEGLQEELRRREEGVSSDFDVFTSALPHNDGDEALISMFVDLHAHRR